MKPLLATTIVLAALVGAAAVGAQPAPAQQTPLQRLQGEIERIIKDVNATWGIYVKSLETGEEIAIDADRQMDTMSVIKIPLMTEVFTEIQAGKFKLTDKYTIAAEDVRPGTGVMRSLDVGDVVTVKDLITLMNIVSDNTATDVLYRMVGGPETVNQRMLALGLKQTRAPANAKAWFDALAAAEKTPGGLDEFHREGKHPFGLSTPREIGQLLEMMERGTLVDKTSSEMMLRAMRGQLYRTRIPRYLAGYRIPHKTGDFLPYIANDVGVLEAPGRTIVICVFTNHHFGSGERLEEAIGRVAQQVGEYFSYRQ